MTEKSMILKEFFIKEFSDLYDKMRECDHGLSDKLNPYHEEGDVWTHTEMVLDALPSTVSDSVVVAALLHDIGKVYTREVTSEGKVRFFNHASRSTFEAIDIVNHISKTLMYSFENVSCIDVLNLINLHCVFFNYTNSQTEKNADKLAKMLYQYGLLFYNDLVNIVKADHYGRITSQKTKVSNEFFELVKVKIKNLIDNFDCSKNIKDNYIDLLIGIPYSGKSFFLENYVNNSDIVIISRDNLIMKKYPELSYNEAWKLVDQNAINLELDSLFRSAVKDNKNIIVDMTNLSRKSRNSKLSQVSKNYNKKASVFYTGMGKIKERIKKRKDKNIDQLVLNRMMNSFQLPTYSEFDEIYFKVTV